MWEGSQPAWRGVSQLWKTLYDGHLQRRLVPFGIVDCKGFPPPYLKIIANDEAVAGDIHQYFNTKYSIKSLSFPLAVFASLQDSSSSGSRQKHWRL